jgi:hypothetical protein
VCGLNPAGCTDGVAAPDGRLPLTLPADGSTATVTLTTRDAAGNTWTSETFPFTRDTAPPAPPSLSLAASSGAARTIAVGGEAGARINAKLCTVGGTCTELAAATAPASLSAALPGPGDYDLVATLTDPYGNTSAPSLQRLTLISDPDGPHPVALRAKVISHLRDRKITVRGSVAAGSANRITVRLRGYTASGRRVSSKANIAVPASGAFRRSLRAPKGAVARRGIEVSVRPQPNAGWRTTTYKKTLRR